MEVLVSNGWTQLWLLIISGVLCLAMSLWLGAQHFRLPKRVSLVKPLVNISGAHDLEHHVPTLHITAVVPHGHIVEIKGVTDAGTTVMINGQRVANIFPENRLRYFLGHCQRALRLSVLPAKMSKEQ